MGVVDREMEDHTQGHIHVPTDLGHQDQGGHTVVKGDRELVPETEVNANMMENVRDQGLRRVRSLRCGFASGRIKIARKVEITEGERQMVLNNGHGQIGGGNMLHRLEGEGRLVESSITGGRGVIGRH